MGVLYASSATERGIMERRQRAPACLPAPEPVSEPVPAPEPGNVVRLVIPKTNAQQIIADVAHKHGLTYADLMSRRRFPAIVRARDEAITAVKALAKDDRLSMSMPMVGRIFGGRDHTTILAALRRHAKRGK